MLTDFYAEWRWEAPYSKGHTTLDRYECREVCAGMLAPHMKISGILDYRGSESARSIACCHLMSFFAGTEKVEVNVYFLTKQWEHIQRSPEVLQQIFDTFAPAYGVQVEQNIQEERGYGLYRKSLAGYKLSGDLRILPCFYWIQFLVRHLTHEVLERTTIENLLRAASNFYDEDEEDGDEDTYPGNDPDAHLDAYAFFKDGKELSPAIMLTCGYGPVGASSSFNMNYWETRAGDAQRLYPEIMSISTVEEARAYLKI